MCRLSLLLASFLLVTTTAQAHVTIWPRESRAGASEKYVARVPTEGKVSTVAVEIEVPEGVTLVAVAAPVGWTYELKRAGERIVAVTWSMEIRPGEFAEFSFIARNPKDVTEIVWKARQRYADGTSADWSDAPGGKRPAAVTKLTPAPAQ